MFVAGRNSLDRTLTINEIECYLIVLSLMAIPEDGGYRRGAASVQTSGVKNAKENHQGGRITSNAATLFLPKRKGGRVKRG